MSDSNINSPTDDEEIPVMRFDRGKDMAADLDVLMDEGNDPDIAAANKGAEVDPATSPTPNIPPATAPEIDANDGAGQSPAEPASGQERATQREPEAPITSPTPNVINLDGLEIPADQAGDVKNLIEWANSMTPAESAKLMDYYNNMKRGVQVSEPPAEVQAQPSPQQPETFIPDDVRGEYPDLAPLFDKIDERFAAYDERFASVEEFDTQIQQRTEAEEQQAAIAVEIETVKSFQNDLGLSDEETTFLHSAAARSNLAPAFIQQFGLEGGFRKTLEFALQSNPDINNRVVAAQLQALATGEEVNARKANAGQLTGDGGNVNRESYVRGETLSPRANKPRLSEKTAAMAADLDRMQSGM